MKLKIVLITAVLSSLAFGGNKMLTVGDIAPNFELNDEKGTVQTLESFKDKNFVVLIFYPGDETPVCTQQLCEVRDDYSSFTANGAVIFAVNPASGQSHKKFSDKNKLPFPLLVDEKMAVASKYGVSGRMMNKRTVFVIGKDGRIVYAKHGKPPVSEILASIRSTGEDSLRIDLKK